jgi:23S rRNA-/tRNA-specific pseudouridylate synthase
MAKRVNALFLEKRVEKCYYAVVHGVPESDDGEIVLPLRYDGHTRRSLVDPIRGKEAITRYRTKFRLPKGILSLLDCEIGTGRTHQIRAHLNHVGHSIVGDRIYCIDPRMEKREARLYLHAWRLFFVHPVSGIGLDFRLGLPRDFLRLLAEKNR